MSTQTTDIRYTSVDFYLNKFPNKTDDVFNLLELSESFEIDTNFESDVWTTTGPFTRLEYSEKIGKGSIEALINRPPIGPIPNNFMCTFCNQYGPNYHLESCQEPNKKSLAFTYKGFKQLVKSTDYPSSLSSMIQQYKNGDAVTKTKILEEYFEDFITKEKDGKRTIIKIPDNAYTLEITYDDIIKTRGKDASAPKTLTTRFSNIVSIYYEYGDNQTTNIRIYKDGSIDIKNIPISPSENTIFINSLIKKINKTEALNKLN